MENAPWQITATKVLCEAVEADTVIVVKKDWGCSCTYYEKWGPARRLESKGLSKILSWLGIMGGERRMVTDKCTGPTDCVVARGYVRKLMSEQKQ